MTTKMILFIIIITLWFAVGCVGTMRAKEDRINWEMIIILILAPFLPIIARLCGLI